MIINTYFKNTKNAKLIFGENKEAEEDKFGFK